MLRALFSIPGLRPAFALMVLGRLPMGAVALVLILRTRELTGSFAAGGLVAAANALGHAVGGPLLGRRVDLRGQTQVLVLAGAAHGSALVTFALLPGGAALALPALCAFVAGFSMPPMGPCLRAIWGTQITDEDQRHAAYSFESAIFELVYIAGPLLFVGLIGAASLQAAAAACGLVTMTGTLLFAATAISRAWRPSGDRATSRAGALHGPGVRVILAGLTVLGVAIAAIEIAVAAFAGSEEKAALLLALWGLGSFLGGMVNIVRGAPADPPRALAALLLVLAVLTAPLALAGGMTSLGLLMVLAGLAIAPSLSIAFSLLGQVAPPGTVTEAFTWTATGFGGGIAVGSALGGWVVETAGTEWAFLVAAGAVAGAALIAAVGSGTLRASLPLRPAPAT